MSASSLPALHELSARLGPGNRTASGDTVLLLSGGFDSSSGSCSPGRWIAEDRSSRVFAHVSDRFVVNQGFFSARGTTSLVLPATIGTPITEPVSVATTDSGSIVYSETINGGGRIVEVYPGQNVMRKYADLVASPSGGNASYLGFDRATGDIIVGSNSDVSGRLYRVPSGGGMPVQIAGNDAGTTDDGDVSLARIGYPYDIETDAAGNIFFLEQGELAARIRVLRTNGRIETIAGNNAAGDGGDGGPASAATFMYLSGIALSEDGATLYLVDAGAKRARRVNLSTGIIDAVPGAQPSDFGADYPSKIAFSNGVLYVSNSFGVIYKLEGGVLTPLTGTRGLFAPPSEASRASADFLHGVSELRPDPSGGAFVIANPPLVLHIAADASMRSVAGAPIAIVMGERALWFGADSTSAPDEVAHWVLSQGYGSGWSQRLTSPEFSFAGHPNAKFEFDAYLETDHDEYDFIASDGQLSFLSVRALQASGAWVTLPAICVERSGNTHAERFTGYGIGHFEVDLTGASLAATTRVQILSQTMREYSHETGVEPPGDGPAVVDNLRVTEGGTDLLAPEDFEDGSTGAWTLSAVNAAYRPDEGNQQFLRDVAPPATNVALRSGFDFSDPSCVWTFTSAGDSVPDGTYARLTSPWIGLADRAAPAFITFSGKLPTSSQMRVLAVMVREKNSGEERPHSFHFSRFVYDGGTSGGDLASPFLDQRTLVYPDDFSSTWPFPDFTPVDSIQIMLQVEDRIEEIRSVWGDLGRTHSRLPYLDELKVYQTSGDSDGDGVPDALDACPAVSGAGQDADGDGCPDATATLRHVESWQNQDRPIHYTISLDGDPAITDGSDLAAIRNAIASWRAVPGAAVPMVEDAPTARKNADLGDGVNLITFEDDLDFPPDVIAVTPTTSFTRRAAYYDRIVLPGQIVDSDLIFNPTVAYRTANTGPIAGSVDLQSVATHEIGHMLGLSHSGVAEATMYPVLQEGDGAASLEDDDRAAIGAAYPGPSYATDFGTIEGTVARGSNGRPVPGALVTAWALDGANTPTHAVSSNYTDEAGRFALHGIAPSGDYAVRIDPLDGSIPGLVPGAINDRVRAIAETNFMGEWWSSVEDGTENPALHSPVAVTPGATTSLALVTPKDVTPPALVSVLPGDGAEGVGIDGRVLINFSEPVDPGTINAAFVLHKTGESGRLGGSAQILDNNRTFIYTPEEPLQFDTTYVVGMTTALTDREGVHLAVDDFRHFRTLATPDVAIFDIQPRQGPAGALITIRGQGFGGGTLQLEYPTIGGPVLLSGVLNTETSVVATVDNGQISGPMRIFKDGVPSNPFNFTVLPTALGLPQLSGSPVALSLTPSDVAVSPEGANVFAVGGAGFSTLRLSRNRGEELEPLPGCAHLALSPDGSRAYVTRPEFDEVVEFVTDSSDVGFAHFYRHIPLPGSPEGIYLTPEGAIAFVSERGGSRVWVIDVLPTDAQYRGILSELELAGVTLTGGISVTTETATASPGAPARASSAPRRPRVQLGSYSNLFLTSTSGILDYNLYYNSFEIKNATPSEGSLATLVDGSRVIAPGAGPDATKLLGASLANLTPPPLVLGGRIRDVTVSTDGSVMLVNSLSSQLEVLDAAGRTPKGVVGTGRNPVALAASGDGRTIAVANAGDNTIGVYVISGGRNLDRLSTDVAMPGDRVALAVGGSAIGPNDFVDLGQGPIAPTTTDLGSAAFTVPPLSQRVTNISVGSPDFGPSTSLPFTIVDPIRTFVPKFTGTTLTAGPQNCASVTGRYDWLGVTLDGAHLVTLRGSNACGTSIALYQLRDGAPEPLFTILRDLIVAESHVVDAAFSHDGSLWAALGSGDLLRYDIDLASTGFGSSSVIGPTQGTTYAVATNPFKLQIAASRASLEPDEVDFYRSNDGSSDGFVSLPDPVHALAFSPDGQVLVAGGAGRAFFIAPPTWEYVPDPTPTIVATSPQHAGTPATRSLAVTADGRRAVGVFDDGNLCVWSLEPGSVGVELYYGQPFPGGAAITQLVTAPDGSGVIAGCGNLTALFHVETRVLPPSVIQQPVPNPAFTLARTPDGRHVFASTENSETLDRLNVYTLSEGARLTLTSGGAQEALAGEPLPLPVKVHLVDSNGQPQYGAEVDFALAGAAHGELEGSDPLLARRHTDINGDADVRWTMPATPGMATLTVTAPGLAIGPLEVRATAAASAASAYPELVALGPPDGAFGIAAGSEVFARFSQSMDTTSAAEHLRLAVGSDVIPGRYRLDDRGRAVFFKPDEPLPFAADATLEIDAGMLDTEGQALQNGAVAHFSVQARPALGIAVVTPPAGVPGTEVTLLGDGFGSVPAQNTVAFNGTLAAVVSASARTLVVRVPALATTGDVTVQVASTTSAGKPFVVLDPSARGGAIADTMPSRPSPLALAITPDGKRMYVVSARTNTVGAIDIRSARDLGVIPVGANPRAIAMLPDGSRAYTANYDGGDLTVIGTDPDSAESYNRVVGTVRVGSRPVGVVVLRGGPRVLVVNQGDSTVSVIDAQRGNSTFEQVIKNIPLPGNGGNITISPDGTRAFIATGAGVSVLDLASFVIKNIPLPGNGGNITISPDGGLLYVIAGDHHLYVIDVGIGSEYRVIKNVPLPGNGGNITISPDGTRIYVSLPDANTVLVFEIERGTSNGSGHTSTNPGPAVTLTLLATLPVGTAPSAVAADPFGRFVAVTNEGSDDVTLIVTSDAVPRVQVRYPNGGESLTPGLPATLTWDTDLVPGGQTADLELSRDLGLSWTSIASGIENTGAYDWLVTEPQTRNGKDPVFGALVRVTVRNLFGVAGSDTSDHGFAIFDAATPALLAQFTAEPRANGIELRWQLAEPARFGALAVERAPAATGPWTALDVTQRAEGERVVALDASAAPGHSYWYRIAAQVDGRHVILGTLDEIQMPVTEFALEPIAPNPARAAADIDYAVARSAHVRLSVIDVTGRRVTTLVDGVRPPGLHRVRWSGEATAGRAPAGLYFVRYEAAGRSFVRRLVYMR